MSGVGELESRVQVALLGVASYASRVSWSWRARRKGGGCNYADERETDKLNKFSEKGETERRGNIYTVQCGWMGLYHWGRGVGGSLDGGV